MLPDSLGQGRFDRLHGRWWGSVSKIMLALEGAGIQPGDQIVGAPGVKAAGTWYDRTFDDKDQNFVVDRDASGL